MLAGPPQAAYGATEPAVYHYQDPRTGQTVASLLPPDHPKMVCLQAGEHVPEARFGFLGAYRRLCFLVPHGLTFLGGIWMLGVLAAIVWFPLGIGLCLLDRRVRCSRCGEMLEEGICS